METKYLTEFLKLAEVLDYREASEFLFISQSTLSRHIMSLEQELGVSLFYRTTRHVELSEYGKALIPYATNILNEQDRFIRENITGTSGDLVVSFPGAMAPHDVAVHFRRFQQENPGIRLLLVHSADYLSEMYLNKCSFVFIPDGVLDDTYPKNYPLEIQNVPFLTDRMVCVIPNDHPLAKKEVIGLSDLADNLVLVQYPYYNAEMPLMQSCQKEKIKLHIHRVNSSDYYEGSVAVGMIDAVVINHVIAIIPERDARFFKHGPIKIVPIGPMVPCYQVIAYKKHTLTPEENTFLNYITSIPNELQRSQSRP